ncbi:hypothetical protein WALSEDRAFT_69776 [Wallemia mellicola CBS 633.66]|uniref:Zn(2)-C6 fungal-type domain-containing protein n=2 Tax=Wallemia mellicola TaxID=1708541 RepID=A0A4T0N7X2_9BASI|nr:hypothetical protein WALSEDRAFT_69776 [Wallemia mellicola CBS 633.66]TIB70825.1 hypothetical protein E3Q24_02736 [Wallemia mellicola]EIM20408.1 hypothetical protein WALSEDRAFT_69776 [Wallemia mellicola CBS 633.66]TIB75992.1 hypothetical protein E3Q23_02042 [Wallemia mellicola]TIB92561.1 hypothetical protein E3Q19_01874 [Wallemia mellicola]TIC10362.1 hypothetical protein E3Q14_02842 [Wallemia mellicola]|eukprot:XP_006959434.1 hypothetical protein WALSEDRAFT_69776 [Wallemia mellicola CBS 633.66]
MSIYERQNKRSKQSHPIDDASIIPIQATDSQGQPVTKLKKQKACLTCRRAKLKCEIPVPGEPCKRCISTGVECKFRTRTHDEEWQSSVESRISQLADKVDRMSQSMENFLNHMNSGSEFVNQTKFQTSGNLPSPPTSSVTRKSSDNPNNEASSLFKGYVDLNSTKTGGPFSPFSVPNHTTLSGASALLAQTHVHNTTNQVNFGDSSNGPNATSGFLSILDELLDPDNLDSIKSDNSVSDIKQMNFEPVGLDPIFDNPESTSDHIAANSTKENMNSLTVGSLDPRPNVIKKGVISQSAAEELVDFFHSNLSSQLFGFRLQIGHFPYLPEGKSTLTPLITGVICLASSERILSDNLRSLVGNLLVDLDDFSFKPAITQYYSSQNQESIDDDELDLELGVGPEEIVAMCIASIFCDMSTRPNPKKSTIDGCNSSSHMIAQVAFKWARGFLKTSMLSVPPQMTIGEACGYLPPRRQLGLENWLRLWLFTYVVESQASFYSSRPSKMYDPTSFCTLLLEASAPGHPNDNSRDKQLVAHARICTLLRQARQTLDSRDWLNSNLSDTRSCLDGWNEELESWRRVNLPESALIAADQWPATSLTLFYLFARLYINQIAIGDSIMQSQEENFGTSSERWRYATAAVKAAAQMLDAVAEEPLCSTWSLLPLIYIKMISLAAGVLLKSVHVLDKIAPVVTIEQIRVSVIKVAEILKNGAPGQSETHLARATSASLINQVAKLQPTARSLQT